jgi:hypothetical protein
MSGAQEGRGARGPASAIRSRRARSHYEELKRRGEYEAVMRRLAALQR